MTTFERYFIADKATHVEKRNAYYTLRDTEVSAKTILEEFGLDPNRGIIINGHVPVKSPGRAPDQGQWPPDGHRRRFLARLPEADRDRRLHPDLQLTACCCNTTSRDKIFI